VDPRAQGIGESINFHHVEISGATYPGIGVTYPEGYVPAKEEKTSH